MSREAAGSGTIAISNFDLLRNDLNRPDLFEERTSMRFGAHRSNSQNRGNIGIALLTVLASASIFVWFISIATLIQTALDAVVVNDIISTLVTSRFYFVVVTTFLMIIVLIFVYYVYMNIRPLDQ